MGKPEGLPTAASAAVTSLRGGERRRQLRLKFSRPVRVGSEAKYGHVEEVRTTLNVSRDGLYFTTSLEHYRVGMLTAVTFPYSPADPVKMEETHGHSRSVSLAVNELPPAPNPSYSNAAERKNPHPAIS